MKSIVPALFLLAACQPPSVGQPTQNPPATPDGTPTPTPTPTPSPSPSPTPTPTPTPSPTPTPTATPTKTVLLIPGTMITGDYFDTMADRLRSDGFSPQTWVDPDLLTGSLADGAAKISAAVDAAIAASGEKRIHIVAQCDGGVATRYYLQLLGGDSRVDQVVTFVSAHHGTWESPVGSAVSGFQALDDITPGSDFMNTLNSAPFPAGLKLTSIYSCNDPLMVPYTTSVVAGATNVEFCTQYIGHFDPFWDPVVYQRILVTLQGNGATAPTSY